MMLCFLCFKYLNTYDIKLWLNILKISGLDAYILTLMKWVRANYLVYLHFNIVPEVLASISISMYS